MKLIVGLGNPGKKYQKTRHNIGFRVIDVLKREISNKDIILLKPDTFMNNSGKAVKKAIASPRLVGLGPKNLIVIHDDIDLPFGTIRVSKNVSSAGHRGVQSTIDELGTQDFTRIRIGIRPPSFAKGFGGQAEKFVLEKFSKIEEKQLKQIIIKAIDEVTAFLSRP